jgi:hypothetical protein
LDTWPQWHASKQTQLDQFHELGMYGKPCYSPPGAITLSPHWQYRIKISGKRHSRNCCDGSPRAAPKLHALAETYASCMEETVSCHFFALAAALNYLVYGGDAQDAFAHSPAPKIPTFVHINKAFAEWYKHRFSIILDCCQVLYAATIDTHKILLLRQVDDFVIATPDPAIAAHIYEKIGQLLQLPGKSSPPFEQLGLVESFNGVHVTQT